MTTKGILQTYLMIRITSRTGNAVNSKCTKLLTISVYISLADSSLAHTRTHKKKNHGKLLGSGDTRIADIKPHAFTSEV